MNLLRPRDVLYSPAAAGLLLKNKFFATSRCIERLTYSSELHTVQYGTAVYIPHIANLQYVNLLRPCFPLQNRGRVKVDELDGTDGAAARGPNTRVRSSGG